MGTSTVPRFRRLGVIGAGNMGGGIAQKMASEGFEVVLVDLDDEKLSRGREVIRKTLAEGVERRLFRPAEAQGILDRIRATTDWAELAGVDLAVEAVFEDAAVKREVFRRLDECSRPETILATNTSSLSVTELAGATRRPERVLGLHYFYHPAKNRLVEVVPGEATDPAVLRAAWLLQEQLGKTPIGSADVAGFVVNRFFVPWLNEAVRLVEEGIAAIPAVEEASRKTFGVGMGPFQLMNVTGLPIAMHAAATLGRRFGPFYEPAKLLERQVASGQPWDLGGAGDPAQHDVVSERMLAVVFYVASALVDEGVGTIEDADIGARVGLRWPRGPFELMNRHGVAPSARLVQSLADRWQLTTPRILAGRAERGEPFTFRVVRSELREGVATLTVNRPDAMNALNEEVVAQLHDAFREAAGDPRVRGIVIAGAGKAFVAGADIRFFVRNIEAGSLPRILEFTRDGHALLDEIDRSPKPVVARLHGLALGGGVELALACDRIVATPKASLAFPETGIGIYPGLGGTQRAPRRVGRGLAKWLIFTGQMVPAEAALAIGLVDRLVPHEELDQAVVQALEEGPRPAGARATLPAEYAAFERFFDSATADALLAGTADTQGKDALAQAMQRVRTKAPRALRLAEKLIEEGASGPIEQGLKMELDHLQEIFATEDAYEGLSALGKRKPVFKGC